LKKRKNKGKLRKGEERSRVEKLKFKIKNMEKIREIGTRKT